MAAGKEFNAFRVHPAPPDVHSRKPVGEGGFWTIHVDSVVTAVVLGILGIGFLWWVVRGATAGVPNQRQAFVELLIDFIDDQVKGIFTTATATASSRRSRSRCSSGCVLMNSMDFLPVDWVAGALRPGRHARMAHRADRRRQHHLRARALGVAADDRLRHQGEGRWAAGSTSCSARRSARTRCCGRPTSCSTSSSTSPSRCRTRCGCSATCTRARSCSCCCGCGRRPASSAPSSASCWAWAGRSSTS